MEPKLLMLDEPSMGLAPIVVDEVFAIIRRVNQQMHIPILLVEQNAFMALSVSQHSYVLENGKITLAGNSEELLQSEDVKKSYLGG
jgi:branched-chain amino acid transport system ATP-binding protein